MTTASLVRGKDSREVEKFEDYTPSKPQQLDLFELLGLHNKPYSNTIELYDFMPKYYWAMRNRKDVPRALEREFECRGISYKLTVTPARIKGKDGVFRDHYPGKREELVEDALRKLAAEGQGVFLSDDRGEAASVRFTLYELRKELEERGHGYNLNEIRESLQICKRTNLIVTTEDGSAVLESNIFETLGLQTREDWKGAGKKTRCFVRFNPLVTRGIKSGAFRRLNYDKAMAYGLIARQLFKRLSHHYTQANLVNRYTVMLTTLIRDFGLTHYKQLRDNLREMQAALEEMKGKGDLLLYEIHPVVDSKQRNKLIDAKIVLTTAPGFNADALEANQRHKSGQPLLPLASKP